MKLFGKLFENRKNIKKRLEGTQEGIMVFIHSPREHSFAEQAKQKSYIKSVVNGVCHDVNVSDANIIQLLIDWIKNPEPIEAFGKLLAQIDVKFPVKLKDLSGEYHNIFTCETSDGKILNITIIFGDGWDRCDQIQVECDGKASLYTYSSTRIDLALESITVVKGDAKLYNFYCEFFCHRKLTLPNNYEFVLEVDEPKPKNDKHVRVLQNAEAIENYILNIASNPISSFYALYQDIKKLYQFDNATIKAMKCFKMSLSKKVDNKTSEITGAVVINNGQLQEYAETQNGVTVYWSKDGNWMYKTLNTLVSFDQKLKKSTVSIICEPGSETDDVNIGSIAKLAEAAVKNAFDSIIIP